jgi:branched-chain amino acid transport system substrate-binding protein
VGIVRAANEIGLNVKMFGGAMIGLLATPIKLQLGALMNGLVIMESFIPAPTLNFPGLKSMLDRYQAKAPSLGIDPLGYGFTPFAYAAGEAFNYPQIRPLGGDNDHCGMLSQKNRL